MKKAIRSDNLIKVAITAVILCISMTTCVFADNSPPSESPFIKEGKKLPSIEIKGKHYVDDPSIKSGSFTFILTSENKDDPMPAGSVNGVKKVTVSPCDEFNFGKIVFQKQGNYRYQISRGPEKIKDMEIDRTVYHVEIQVFATGEVVMVFSKEGSAGKPKEIEYKDKYTGKTEKEKEESSSGRKTPLTGDDAMMLLICTISMFVALGILQSARMRKKYNKKN